MQANILLKRPEYAFLGEHERLGGNIILLGLGGSYAYGTNIEDSDIDIRGVALQQPSDLIGLTKFEQYESQTTDTVIYGFNKMIGLLLNCNPNVIEILGLDEDQYLIKAPFGEELVANAHLFLSRKAIHSFGGYAEAQLRRLQNTVARDALPQSEREKHILHSVRHALEDFNQKHAGKENRSIRLYIDASDDPERETEIFVDADYKHYPLRDYSDLWGTMKSVVRDYDKLGKRNTKKDDNHLNKHAMHLIRIMMMAEDILLKEQVITHRKDDLPILRSIRRGDFRQTDGSFSPAFFELAGEYERRLEEAAKATKLPEGPDMEKVELFVEKVNRAVIIGDARAGNF